MHDEDWLRKIAKIFLEKYGVLSTRQMVKLMRENVEFDEEDLKPNKENRQTSKTYPNGEPYVIQRIRNIPSRCKPGEIKIYEEGFLINRKQRNIKWIVTSGLSGKETRLPTKKLEEKKEKLTNNKSKKRPPVIIDWDIVNERNTDLGAKGEKFVYENELDFVKSFSPESIEKVSHLSMIKGDGLGYDIISIDKKGRTVYIEVKTTKGCRDTPFYLTINEKRFLKENPNAYIYRVYNFDVESKRGQILKIKSKEFFREYIFDPISFRVAKKT